MPKTSPARSYKKPLNKYIKLFEIAAGIAAVLIILQYGSTSIYSPAFLFNLYLLPPLGFAVVLFLTLGKSNRLRLIVPSIMATGAYLALNMMGLSELLLPGRYADFAWFSVAAYGLQWALVSLVCLATVWLCSRPGRWRGVVAVTVCLLIAVASYAFLGQASADILRGREIERQRELAANLPFQLYNTDTTLPGFYLDTSFVYEKQYSGDINTDYLTLTYERHNANDSHGSYELQEYILHHSTPEDDPGYICDLTLSNQQSCRDLGVTKSGCQLYVADSTSTNIVNAFCALEKADPANCPDGMIDLSDKCSLPTYTMIKYEARQAASDTELKAIFDGLRPVRADQLPGVKR